MFSFVGCFSKGYDDMSGVVYRSGPHSIVQLLTELQNSGIAQACRTLMKGQISGLLDVLSMLSCQFTLATLISIVLLIKASLKENMFMSNIKDKT